MPLDESRRFLPVNIAVLTVSDTRDLASDRSGETLAARIAAAGHRLAERAIERDEADAIEARLRRWIADPQVDCVITTGGTGITGRDVTPEAFARVLERFGRLDLLFNNAGRGAPAVDFDELSPEDWDGVVAANLNGTFFTNRVVVPSMRERNYGRIVNIASVAGKEGNPNASAYSASKAGVIGFTKSLGKELAGVNVAVNCVTPAAARTRIFEQMSGEHIAFMLSKIPRGRFLELE